MAMNHAEASIDHAAGLYVDEFRENGYTIIPDLMSDERLVQAREKCEDWLEDFAANKIGGGKVRGRYRKNLLPLTRMFDDLYTLPLILEIVGAIFGRDGFRFGGAMIKNVVPGEECRAMHQDDSIFPEPRPGSPCLINTLLALDDFTKETGATHVVPGSHMWTRPVELDHEYVSAEMAAGSLLMIHGALWHQNGRNLTTDQERRALSFGYRHYDLTSRKRHLSKEVLDALPEKLCKLL